MLYFYTSINLCNKTWPKMRKIWQKCLHNKKIPHTGDTNSLDDADSKTDTNLKRLRDFLFFFMRSNKFVGSPPPLPVAGGGNKGLLSPSPPSINTNWSDITRSPGLVSEPFGLILFVDALPLWTKIYQDLPGGWHTYTEPIKHICCFKSGRS